jgi:hypothetical protein
LAIRLRYFSLETLSRLMNLSLASSSQAVFSYKIY